MQEESLSGPQTTADLGKALTPASNSFVYGTYVNVPSGILSPTLIVGADIMNN